MAAVLHRPSESGWPESGDDIALSELRALTVHHTAAKVITAESVSDAELRGVLDVGRVDTRVEYVDQKVAGGLLRDCEIAADLEVVAHVPDGEADIVAGGAHVVVVLNAKPTVCCLPRLLNALPAHVEPNCPKGGGRG